MLCFFFFKQKTAYEMRISDWSSDVCSSDLIGGYLSGPATLQCAPGGNGPLRLSFVAGHRDEAIADSSVRCCSTGDAGGSRANLEAVPPASCRLRHCQAAQVPRSEEPPTELQYLIRISYAVLCLKKKTQRTKN